MARAVDDTLQAIGAFLGGAGRKLPLVEPLLCAVDYCRQTQKGNEQAALNGDCGHKLYFTGLDILHQHIPYTDDMAHRTEEHEEVEDGMVVLPLV